MIADATVDDRLAGSVPFQTMCAVAVAAWQLVRQAKLGPEADAAFAKSKPSVARYFLDAPVPEALGLSVSATVGASNLYWLSAEELANA